MAVLAPSHLAAPKGLVHSNVSAASLMPLQGQQQQSVMAAPQLDAGFASHQSSMASAMPAIVLQAEDQPPSDMLKAQAQTLKVSWLQLTACFACVHQRMQLRERLKPPLKDDVFDDTAMPGLSRILAFSIAVSAPCLPL